MYRCLVCDAMCCGSDSGQSTTSSTRHHRCASTVPNSTWPRPRKHRPPDATLSRGGRGLARWQALSGSSVTSLAIHTGPNSSTSCPSAACPRAIASGPNFVSPARKCWAEIECARDWCSEFGSQVTGPDVELGNTSQAASCTKVHSPRGGVDGMYYPLPIHRAPSMAVLAQDAKRTRC